MRMVSKGRMALVFAVLAASASTTAELGCSTSADGAVDSAIPDVSSGNDSSGMRDREVQKEGSVCAPKALPGYQPPPFRPAVPQQNACGPSQIQSFYTLCVGPQSNGTMCQLWTSQNKSCEACLETAESALAWGALVFATDGYHPNAGGCIATLGYLECAKRAQALWACGDAACHDDCPLTEDGGNTAYEVCRTAAKSSVCKTYGDAVDLACPIPLGAGEGGSIALCLQSDLQAFYMAFAPILCAAGG